MMPTPPCRMLIQSGPACSTPATASALPVLWRWFAPPGARLGSWQEHKSGGIGDQVDLAPLILLPDREVLYERCDTRFAAMLDQGAVEEVEALLTRGLSSELPVMRAIGVPEIAGWLRGEWSREEAIERGAQSTRNYAKRQYTWFRNQPPQDWLREKPENIVIDDIFEILFRQSC